jgi:hypothetical protein
MEDIIDIIVTETTNTIEITAQPNDEIIDVNIIDNREDVTLNVTPTVVEININSLTGNFGVEWGDITGTLADQEDLQDALDLKADLVDGKVPSSQLPSYVDDVVEVATFSALPATGEIGKIYVILDTNKIYRWSGSVYVEIADSTAVWGAITGTLSSQTDLQSALDAKLSVTTAASTYVPYTGATGDVNLGVNVLKSNNVILDGDTSATGYLGFKQFSGAQGGGLGYSSISATGLTKFYFRAYQTGADVKSFNFDLASLTNLTERNYTLPDANGTLALTSDLTAYVPYTGATANVDLGAFTLLAAKGTFSSSGSSDTVGITHSSGSGIALNITKGGNGEGIYVNKSSGSGNAVTIVGTLNATTLVKNGGTSSQFLKADGSVDSTSYQPTLTNPVTGTGTSGIVAKFSGTSAITDSIIYDNGSRVSIGANVTTSDTLTSVSSTTSAYAVVAQASGAANGFWSTILGTGEIFRGQTSGGSYFIINNGGNAFLNGNLNVGDFASTSFRLNVVGTGNFTGALSGTSATFSGNVGIGNNVADSINSASGLGNLVVGNGGSSSQGITIYTNSSTYGGLNFADATSGGGAYAGYVKFDHTNDSMGFFIGNTQRFSIASTGAATFSSSVTAFGTSTFLGQFGNGNNVNEKIIQFVRANSTSIVNIQGINAGVGAGDIAFQASGGNVGIGTTAPTGTYGRLSVAGGISLLNDNNGKLEIGRYSSGASNSYIKLGANSDSLRITNNTDLADLFTITNAGNVGIGTTSPASFQNYRYLQITGGNDTQGGVVRLTTSAGTYNAELYTEFSGTYLTSSGLLAFYTAGSERMRITSDGRLLVGTTTTYDARITCYGENSSSSNFTFRAVNTNGQGIFSVRNDGQFRTGDAPNSPYNLTVTGRAIFSDSTGVLGYLASVREAKTNINSLTNVSWIYDLNPVSFNYRKKDFDNKYTEEFNESLSYGLIADEVEKVNSDLVFYDNVKGKKQLRGVEYEKLVPALVKVVQELKAELDTLKNK